jgi:hypothetical protein
MPRERRAPIASEAAVGGGFCLSLLPVILPEPQTPSGQLKAIAGLDPFFRERSNHG